MFIHLRRNSQPSLKSPNVGHLKPRNLLLLLKTKKQKNKKKESELEKEQLAAKRDQVDVLGPEHKQLPCHCPGQGRIFVSCNWLFV